MKVQFRNDNTIFRIPINTTIKIIVTMAMNDSEEEEVEKVLIANGWTGEELKKFDEDWEKSEDILPEILDADILYKEIKKWIDVGKFWSMK